MKKFINLMLGTIIIVTTFIFSVINWENFSDVIPIHFSISGNTNGWANKQTALLLLPVSFLIGHIIMCLSFIFAKKRYPLILSVILQLIFPITSILYEILILSGIYNYELNIFFISMIFVSLIFIIVGNYLPSIYSETPYLLRILGWLFFIGGILILIFTLINKNSIILILLPILLIPILIISVIIFVKSKTERKNIE